MKLQDRESAVVLGGFLGIVSLLAALLLAFFSQITEKPIQEAKERTRQAVFHRLGLQDFDSIGKAISVDKVLFYPVLKDKTVCGYVGQGGSSGYGGKITVLTGFDAEGKISGVQVLEHKETPGLGANVCDRKFQRTILNLNEKAPEVPENSYLDQFTGADAADSGAWKIRKDGGKFDYLTGATVTSRAVTEAVNRTAEAFRSLPNADKGDDLK